MTKEDWEKGIFEVQAHVKPRALRVGHRAVGDTVPCIAHPLSSLFLMPLFLLVSFPSHSRLSFAPIPIEKLQFYIK